MKECRNDERKGEMPIDIVAWNDKSPNQMGETIAKQIGSASQIDILTGYFFFDGFKSIHDELEKNKNVTLRILVGMDAGIDASGLVYEVYRHEESSLSADCSDEYMEQLREVLRKWPSAQLTEEQSKAWKQYAGMIEEGRLQIRKTCQPNHAKVYIFRRGEDKKIISYIAGSSNFSYAGLAGRNEFNLHVREERAGEIADLFDDLWKTALPIAGKDLKDKAKTSEIVETLDKETPDTTVKPFDAYMKIMHEYLKMHESSAEIKQRIQEILDNAYFTTKDGSQQHYKKLDYQVDAVSDAAKILKICGGVIIADVVGLGKSVIASLLAKLSCKPGIFLVPAHLVPNWENYIGDFNLENWSVHSIDNPEFFESPDFQIAETVIIDEAHNLRNPDIQVYKKLQSELVKRDVILLTATPFNNRPEDLWAMIDLIGKLDKTKLKKDFDTCKEKYNALIKEIHDCYENQLSKAPQDIQDKFNNITAEIRRLVLPFIIRRNRKELTDPKSPYYDELKDLIPNQQPPVKLEFSLTAEQVDFYDKILDQYFAGSNKQFKGAMYQPQVYVSRDKNKQDGSQSQSNLYGMICRFMVSRWESSPAAFLMSLETLQNALTQYIGRFEKHGIFVQIFDRNMKTADNTDDNPSLNDQDTLTDIESLLKKNCKAKKKKSIYYVPSKCKLDLSANSDLLIPMDDEAANLFLKGLKDDLSILIKIRSELKACGVLNPNLDGKFQALKAELKNILNGSYEKNGDGPNPCSPRKIIIFSGFADTVDYISSNLDKDPDFQGKILSVRGKDCINLEQRKEKFKEIESHFRASGEKSASKEKMILVCTDVLSEGVNLNQAGVVVNYDLCYNPVRVIQRIGRINRIDKKIFENIYNINIFPSEKDINGMGKIAIQKMLAIHSIIREDAQVLSLEEKPLASSNLTNDQDYLDHALNDASPLGELSVIRKMYQAGLVKFSSDPYIRKQYISFLDRLPGRFSMVPGSCETLYLFYRSGLSVKTVKLPDISDWKNPMQIIPLPDALKNLNLDPKTPKLDFILSEKENPHYKAMQDANKGLWLSANNSFSDLNKLVSKCKELGIYGKDILNNIGLFIQTSENKKMLKEWLKKKDANSIKNAVRAYSSSHKISKIKDDWFFAIGITQKGKQK